MNLVCCGISHRSSTVAEREKFQLSIGELSEAVVKIRRISGAEEVAVLATCNRIEYYFSHNQKVDPRDWVNEFYADLEESTPIINDQ